MPNRDSMVCFGEVIIISKQSLDCHSIVEADAQEIEHSPEVGKLRLLYRSRYEKVVQQVISDFSPYFRFHSTKQGSYVVQKVGAMTQKYPPAAKIGL
jgi:hypothetical protein